VAGYSDNSGRQQQEVKTDHQLTWEARPYDIPGIVDSYIPYRDGGFIRLMVELSYPDGEKFVQAYHPRLAKLPELEIAAKVLFTIKPASQHERQKLDRSGKTQPDKMEADSVRFATDEEFNNAARSFQNSRLMDTLKQVAQAEQKATEAKSNAQEKEAKYTEELNALKLRQAALDKEVVWKVAEMLAPERKKLDQDLSNLVSSQQATDKRQKELQRQEEEIAPYKRAIPLPRREATLTPDSALPDKLALIWPDLLRSSGLNFRSDIATAFLLSLVSSLYSGSIVLLNGSVGVGKTSLVSQAAEVLGGKCDIIPVRPAWIDPSDLMGFFDPINDTFRPTPFTTALRDITGDRIRFICLDELNLAKVENYAADLLSSIEYSRSNKKKSQEDNSAGHLKLYSKDIEKQLWEEAKDIAELEGKATRAELRRLNLIRTLVNDYPSQSPFPANAVLIGTLNSDETTYDLSPKMIDRSYVITFPPTSFEKPPKWKEYPNQQVSVTELVTQINGAIGIPANHWDDVIEWNKELQGLGIPLGHRVKRDYDVFRATGSVLGLSERHCLGYFLFCKILPRIFFFKHQSNADTSKSETRCKNWLEKLKSEHGEFGPVQVIDTMIQMCEDVHIPIVRYWSKS
jgi:hypothetical protein